MIPVAEAIGPNRLGTKALDRLKTQKRRPRYVMAKWPIRSNEFYNKHTIRSGSDQWLLQLPHAVPVIASWSVQDDMARL